MRPLTEFLREQGSGLTWAMPGNLRTNLEKHLRAVHPKHAALGLLAGARQQIHRAIGEAQKELERFGYHVAIVTDTGSMISAKVYGQTSDRDFMKTAKELKQEFGYPINLQLSPSDAKGLTIYSLREGRQNATLVSSKKPTEILDAINTELEAEIKAGIDVVHSRNAQMRRN
jgi:hypothetical protein